MYRDTPLYQQQIQQRMTLQPWQRAIRNTDDITAAHAGRDMAGRIRSLQADTARKKQKFNIDMGRRKLDMANTIAKRQKQMGRQALMMSILGLAGKGAGMYSGYKEGQVAKSRADEMFRMQRDIHRAQMNALQTQATGRMQNEFY